MKVGIVAWEFPPEIGGMQAYAWEFAAELARRGNQVTVFTRRHNEGEAALPGVSVLPILVGRRRADWAALRRHNVDVWHVMNAAFSWLALETAPVVVSVHGNDFLAPYVLVERPDLSRWPVLWRAGRGARTIERAVGRRRTPHMLRRALPRAAHILANSRYTEQVLLGRFPDCAGRTSAAMVGVGEQFFVARPQRAAGRPPGLITVCRLAEPRKNVDVVLRALASLQGRHAFTYTVVGDGHLRPALERLAMELGLGDRVSFTGFVSSDEVRRRLAESDLFVLTSSVHPGSHEGFGIAYLEANACGTPVLAARLAGAVEAVCDGETGFFVEAPDVKSVAAALDRFLSGRVRFEADACQGFASGFSWSRVVDEAVRWYSGPGAGMVPAARRMGSARVLPHGTAPRPDLISVIMPCFNGAPFVEQAVRSVLGQDCADVELIAVDDGSTDGSRQILERLAGESPGRVTVLHTDRAGPYPARNLALGHANGAFIAFLDADDYWAENCLSALHRGLVEREADVAYCGWQNVGRGPRGGEPFVPPRYETGDTVAAFLRTCPWPIHAALTRRRIIEAVGGFSERRFSAMDYDLWIRMLAVTRRMVLVPEVMAYYRWHDEGQISKVKWRQTLDAWTVRRDFVDANPELVADLDAKTRRRLVDGPVLAAAYDAYWQRDLDSAQRLFRKSLACGAGGWRDMRYLLASLLPQAVYRALISAADRRSTTGAPT